MSAETVGRWGEAFIERPVGGGVVQIHETRPRWIGELLDDGVERLPDEPFLVQGDVVRSRTDLRASSRAIAGGLSARGVAPGDRVLLLAANSPAWVEALFGIVLAGAVPVLGNGWWPADDVHHAVSVTGAAVALTDERRAALVPDAVTRLPLDAVATEDGVLAVPDPPPDEDDPGLIVFTSGTTAWPKAAQLSHRAVVANVHNLLHRMRRLPGLHEPAPPAVHLCAFPLFHMSGVQTTFLQLLTGGRLVFTAGRFDPAEVLALIEAQRVTAWAGVPTMVTRVLEHPDLPTRDTSSLVSLVVGGAPVPDGLRPAAEQAFPSLVRRTGESYGSTESGGTVASGASGMQPLPGVEVRIAEPGPDGVGALLVRSAALMDGYLSVPADEQPVAADGWLHTGDLARIDDHGLLHLAGRSKDIIIRGGENVSPAAVEAALRAHPDVLDAVVVGVIHPTWGEEVAAVVRHTPDGGATQAALEALATERLAGFARPTRWYLTTEELPLTDTGKVRRDDLRKLFD